MRKLFKGILAGASLVIGEELIRRRVIKPAKYSRKWIEELSDSMWETEREIVRKNSINSNLSLSEVMMWESIRRLFDEVKSDRDWADKTPQGPAIHREHGWYLPNDD